MSMTATGSDAPGPGAPRAAGTGTAGQDVTPSGTGTGAAGDGVRQAGTGVAGRDGKPSGTGAAYQDGKRIVPGAYPTASGSGAPGRRADTPDDDMPRYAPSGSSCGRALTPRHGRPTCSTRCASGWPTCPGAAATW